jgi:hypothetical protein
MDKRHVQTLIAAELRRLGFQGAGGSYSLKLGKGVAGFLGATCTGRPGQPVSVWVVVGVRHEVVYGRGVSLGGYAESETNLTLAVAMEELASGNSIGEYRFTGTEESDQAELRNSHRGAGRDIKERDTSTPKH